MAMQATSEPTAIHADSLYSRRGFIAASGLSETRLREAKHAGIEPRKILVGKRVFIRGKDAIDFIERLAEHHTNAQPTPLASASTSRGTPGTSNTE